MMDGAEARLAALRVMQDVLDGSVRLVGELRQAWPPAEADFLLKRARQEAEHYLITRGELERRIVDMLRSFLERGGTADELEQAYDEVIRVHNEETGD